jgi:2-polyprenyl-6-hydroxyphenyl methylase/3-demethylubiquinone-9 3-methyltransferase
LATSAPTRPDGIRAALARYRQESVGIRLFVRARHLLAPLERIAREVPRAGSVLDLGCGHGLFSNLLALQSAERDVLGVDPSSVKIEVARRSSAGLPNLRYMQGYVQDVEASGFDAICILDVLYLLPDAEKLALLRHCRRLIAPDGVLLLKTNDTYPRWKYAVTRLQERAMTGLGLTLGNGQLYFRSAEQNAALLRAAGFRCDVADVGNWLPYPHRLFIARPESAVGSGS